MQIRLLGPVEISMGEHVAKLGPMQRTLLAALACENRKSITDNRLALLLWGERPPNGALTTLRSHVMRLNRVIQSHSDECAIRRAGEGYLLDCPADAIDSFGFEGTVKRGRTALDSGHPRDAISSLDEGLKLWSGAPLSGVPDHGWVLHERRKLLSLRRTAIQTKVDAQFSLGNYDTAISELQALILEHPEDEHLRVQLALAMYRDKKVDQALEVCKEGILTLYNLGHEVKNLRDLQSNIVKRSPELDPVLATTSVTLPRQLPPDVASFTGRYSELHQLHSILASPQPDVTPKLLISAISGAGGVGKTALAVHLAHQLVDDFPDGQLYVNFHGYDTRQILSPGQALDRFLRTLGIADRAIPSELEDRAALYRSVVAGRKMLIVLDNASSAQQLRPLFPQTASCSVIITSRDTLGSLIVDDGAHLLSLDVLDVADATKLLSKVIARPVDAEETVWLERIVTLCGGLPLAVRIAGAKIMARPTFTLQAFCELLEDERYRLEMLNAGDVGVRACFALSYESLPLEVKRVFRLLGLVAGPDFSIEGATALVGRDVVEVRRIIDRLVDAHLLETSPTGDRFRFHDLIRLYARERVSQEEGIDDQHAALVRLLNWYRNVADLASNSVMQIQRMKRMQSSVDPEVDVSSRALAIQWLETERPSLVAAVQQAYDHGLKRLTWELADSQWGFFYLRKHWTDWESTHKTAIRASKDLSEAEAESWMLTNLGVCYWDWHKPENSIECSRAALEIARAFGYELCEARDLNGLALAHRDMEQWQEALGYVEQALPKRRAAHDRWGEGASLNNSALILGKLGRLNESLERFEEALRAWEDVGDRWGVGMTTSDMGRTMVEAGQFGPAVSLLRDAIRIRRSVGDTWGEGQSLYYLGIALKEVEGVEAAKRCWISALNIMTNLNAREAADVRDQLRRTEKPTFP